jgi:hypothetical protein
MFIIFYAYTSLLRVIEIYDFLYRKPLRKAVTCCNTLWCNWNMYYMYKKGFKVKAGYNSPGTLRICT